MSKYREIICDNIDSIKGHVNDLLSGTGLSDIKAILARMDRGGILPDWFEKLETTLTLPNLDGKTIGSVVEKLLACVLEKYVLESKVALHINPAKGVDIPELELGIKSPSENFCTSEPYFSAYERLIGLSEFKEICCKNEWPQIANQRSEVFERIGNRRQAFVRNCGIAKENLGEERGYAS